MAGIMDTVNQRTQLVGQNRLELLLFRLEGPQVYGINVFKVKEVLQCPQLTKLPNQHPVVCGMAHIRGHTISVMDMNRAIGHEQVNDIDMCFIIITEYNMSTQGFLVRSVERIINMNWEAMHAPPKAAGNDNYLTAVTQVDGALVEIIDVEKILAEVSGMRLDVPEHLFNDADRQVACSREILIVDDSAVARKQIQKVVEAAGAKPTLFSDGRQALDYLESLAAQGQDVSKKFSLVISDIEMPEMDGYTLVASIRENPLLKNLYVVLHTSLSGVFNKAMVSKVGADNFLAKFNAEEMGRIVKERVGVGAAMH
jgi:two-component system chemotaxis response regulator CheV